MGDQSETIPSTMEVDNPGLLKRSSSAPLIPQLNSSVPTGSISFLNRSALTNSFPVGDARSRRFSTSSFNPRNYSSSPRTLARIEQIRQEERLDVFDREVAHENKLHSTFHMSQSWEDLTIMVDSSNKLDDDRKRNIRNSKDLDPLNLHVSNFSLASCSPSPTRCNNLPRHCYSPILKFNLSPSPTRKTFATRRSLSPISLRPSTLGSIKRKFDLSENEPPSKRTGGGLLLVQSRLESSSSPLPSSSVSSVGTPESISSVDSPSSFSFTAPDSPSCDHPMRDVSKIDQNIA